MGVLFADVTGSTRLYATKGDARARRIIDECISTMLRVIPRFGGRLIKTIGDEVMCGFPSADEALMAASEMQSEVADNPPAGYPISIHIGLHFGPVLVEGEDVFGDTVNVASYLCAVAGADQILITEATERSLSIERKACVRPVFYAVLKGSERESTVYQVLWRSDTLELTDVNLQRRKLIPADLGNMVLTYGDREVRIDHRNTSVTLGRGPQCGMQVREKFSSREHALIKVQRTHFYLVDQSINGTFVELESGEEVHVMRSDLLLDGAGRISLGRSFQQGPEHVIRFFRDRRSLYRV